MKQLEMTEIKTEGCDRALEQRIFPHNDHEELLYDRSGNLRIFDYPGLFSQYWMYSLHDLSFQERALIGGMTGLTVVGDVSAPLPDVGTFERKKIKIIDASDLWFDPQPTGELMKACADYSRLSNLGHLGEPFPELDLLGLMRLVQPAGDALLKWANLRRAFNRQKNGAPERIYRIIENDETMTEVGIESVVYFSNETFGRPYIKRRKKVWSDSLIQVYQQGILTIAQKITGTVQHPYTPYSSTLTEYLTPSIQPMNLTKDGIPLRKMDTDRAIRVREYFEPVIAYARKQPTVQQK